MRAHPQDSPGNQQDDWGPQGAAAGLGLRCTPLLDRMETLGIPRRPQ
jgi:hypothetical protein